MKIRPESERWRKRKRQRLIRQVNAMTGFPLVDHQQAAPQPCGGCQGCCEAVAVHEIGKGMYQKCEHQCASGCAVYDDRPESCRSYWCLWQSGMLPGDDRRPDRLGVLFDWRSDGGVEAVHAWELWPGAAESESVMEIVRPIAARVAVLVRRYGDTGAVVHGFGPNGPMTVNLSVNAPRVNALIEELTLRKK